MAYRAGHDAPALGGHNPNSWDAINRIIATGRGDLSVTQNFDSMTLSYNADDTISQIDIDKTVGGSTVTERLSFTYTSGKITGITKTVV